MCILIHLSHAYYDLLPIIYGLWIEQNVTKNIIFLHSFFFHRREGKKRPFIIISIGRAWKMYVRMKIFMWDFFLLFIWKSSWKCCMEQWKFYSYQHKFSGHNLSCNYLYDLDFDTHRNLLLHSSTSKDIDISPKTFPIFLRAEQFREKAESFSKSLIKLMAMSVCGRRKMKITSMKTTLFLVTSQFS